jgi:CBS domain-containing protein
MTHRLRVADALVPLDTHVGPESPLADVLDIMARRAVSAVAVVGDSGQVLGILTAGDALRLFLKEGAKSTVAARDVMTRAVLCVTEEQELLDAARVMVQKNLRQLPVVREGAVLGFVTRESVLHVLTRHPKSLTSETSPT